MRRRDVLAWLVGVAVLWPLAFQGAGCPEGLSRRPPWDSHAMFPKAIEALRGPRRSEFSFEPLWTEGHFERIGALAEQLVRSKVDVIVAPSRSTLARQSELPQRA